MKPPRPLPPDLIEARKRARLTAAALELEVARMGEMSSPQLFELADRLGDVAAELERIARATIEIMTATHH